ncbi:hypothetical protein VPH35_079400 [Triticum aestivum]
MLCPALPPSSYVKLTRVASPRHHPSWNSLPPPILPRFPRGERQAGVRACGLSLSPARPGGAWKLPRYPHSARPTRWRSAVERPDVPSSRRGGRSVKSRRRARAGNPEGEWRGTAAQGVARPSVLPIRERFNTTTPERPRLLPSSRQQQLFPHSAWGLGFPSRSPHLAPRRRRPGRRRGLLAAEGWLRPARARGMRPVPSVEQWGMEPRLLMMLGKGNSSSWINVLPPQAWQLYILLFFGAWQT